MKIIDWLGNLFVKNKDTQSIVFSNYKDDDNLEQQYYVESFALFTVIDLIASLISKCEFKVYEKGYESKKYEWYALNYKPNKNQNASEFWREYVTRLLFKQEALIVQLNDGQMIIADSYNKNDNGIDEIYFDQVSRGEQTLDGTFFMSDVIFIQYSSVPIKSAIYNLIGIYQKLIAVAGDKYEKSNGTKIIMDIPALAKNDKNFEVEFQKLQNEYFRDFFNSKNSVLPLWGGITCNTLSGSKSGTTGGISNEVSDTLKMIDDALSKSAQIYKLPVAIVKGDIAGIEEAVDLMLTNCISPVTSVLGRELTVKKYKPDDVIKGNYINVDISKIKYIDIMKLAGNIDKLIASGFASPDEARVITGLTATNEPAMQKHYITKNYTAAEGGETNE